MLRKHGTILSRCKVFVQKHFSFCLVSSDRHLSSLHLCVHDSIISCEVFLSFVASSLQLLHLGRCWVCVWRPGLYASWGRSSSPLRLTSHRGRLHGYSVDPSAVGGTGHHTWSSSIVSSRSIGFCEWYKTREASYLTSIWLPLTVFMMHPRSIDTQHNPTIINVMIIEIKTVIILLTKESIGQTV